MTLLVVVIIGITMIVFIRRRRNPNKSGDVNDGTREEIEIVRDGFKTQPPVDGRFRPVPPGFYCSKQ